jgi:hypothetical protein
MLIGLVLCDRADVVQWVKPRAQKRNADVGRGRVFSRGYIVSFEITELTLFMFSFVILIG